MSSAESPEKGDSKALTDEEQAKLEELQAKQREVDAAEAAEKAEEAAEAKAEEAERIANRPLHHVLVRHMGRSARTRTMRAGRAGHRRQGVLLDNGKRIRKKGKGRYTEVNLLDLVNNHQRLMEYVRVGTIEVCDPRNEQAIPYDALVEMIDSLGRDMSARAEELMATYQAEKAEYDEAVEEYAKDMKVYGDALREVKDGEEPPEAPEKPVPPVNVPPWAKDFSLNLSGVQDDAVPGSDNPDNSAPTEGGSQPPSGEDVTNPDMGQGALLAAVDQHEAEANGEASASTGDGDTGLLDDEGADAGGEDDAGGEGDAGGEDAGGEEGTGGEEDAGEGDGGADAGGGEDEGYSEEQLLGMGLEDLKKLAVKEFGVPKKGVKKLRAKKDVVALIMEAGASGDEE